MIRPIRLRSLALALAVGGLSACTEQHEIKFSPNYRVPAGEAGPLPLRIGLLMPEASAMPPSVIATRCAFGKGIVTVPYGDEYARLAYQVAARRFKSVEFAADRASAGGRYDALLEFRPATISAESSCILTVIAFWQIWPLFIPPSGYTYGAEAGARILDSAGRETVAEAERSGSGWFDSGLQDGISSVISDVLSDLTASPKFISYLQSAKQASISGPERQGDGASRLGRAPQAVAHYLEAYQACADGDPAQERLFKKLVDAARLGALAIPAEAQKRGERGQAFIKLAKDEQGFAKAAREFEAAAAAAPWWAEAHFNLGLAREKAGDPRGAAASLKRFLLAAPDAPEAAAVEQKIVELEVAQELKGGGPAYERSEDEAPLPASKPARRKEKGRPKPSRP